MSAYDEFIESKRHSKKPEFTELAFCPPQMFDFQRHLVEWALGETRSAIFADTGMGKTLMQLTWAENVRRITGKRVLVLAPLIVIYQTVKESQKFGLSGVGISRDGNIDSDIVVTNYEQLDKFSPKDFGGVVCDESGILKSLSGGVTRNAIVAFMKKTPYRLLCSATPAPNDYVELGNSSEALGVMGLTSMQNKYFVNGRDNSSERRHFGKAPKWEFRGHSEVPFWRWVASWAKAIRQPSDIGFSDDGYVLPDPIINHHQIDVAPPPGMLFSLPAKGWSEQRDEIKRTVKERCQKAYELTRHDQPYICWVNRIDEAKELNRLCEDAVEVSGSDSDEAKVSKIQSFMNGDIRGLITKPSIAAWGLNFQHCAHMTYFPTHSYEEWYQSLRRCHRYGQTKTVVADLVFSPGEQRIIGNMIAKSRKADAMHRQLVALMNNPLQTEQTVHTERQELPSWLSNQSQPKSSQTTTQSTTLIASHSPKHCQTTALTA